MRKRITSVFICLCLALILPSALPIEKKASADENTYTGPYVKVGETTLPLAEYMPGTYFTRNGEPCTCHYSADCVANGSDCNCMRYYPTGDKETCEIDLMAVQCFGFARLVFYKCFGFIDQSANASLYYNVGSLSRAEVNENSVKSLLMKAAPGAHVRLSQGHSVSILTMDEDFIVIYHGNAGGDGVASAPCIVSTRRYTWAQFASAASAGIDYIHMPYNYPDSSLVQTEKTVGCYKISSDTGLRLRAKANTSSETYSVIPFGEIISVTETDGLWGKTSYGGNTGWVFLEYTVYYSALKISPSGSIFSRGSDGFLRMTAWKTDLDSFSEYFDKQSLVIKYPDGASVLTGDYISTGMKISLVAGGKTLDSAVICVAGDINSNGILDVGDYLMARRAYFGTLGLTQAQLSAADVSGNGEIDATDYLLIKRFFFTDDASLFDKFLM